MPRPSKPPVSRSRRCRRSGLAAFVVGIWRPPLGTAHCFVGHLKQLRIPAKCRLSVDRRFFFFLADSAERCFFFLHFNKDGERNPLIVSSR